MNWVQAEPTNPKITCTLGGWMIMAMFLLVAANLPAQAQQGGSLADAARQARAQKQSPPGAEVNAAQQVADELSEEQNDVGAPGGFKTFNAGDYKLWVPAPYRVSGHDDAGVVLDGPMFGQKHPIVLVGTPIVAHFGNDDDAFHDTATKFAKLYAQSANCTKGTVANHPAYQCSLAAGNLLGQIVGGNAVFVQSAGMIYPVFCLAPTDSGSRDYINNKHTNSVAKEWAQESLNREDDDVRKVLQKCDTVFQSIQIRAGAAPPQKQADSGNAAKPVAAQAGSAGGPGPSDTVRPVQQTAAVSAQAQAAAAIAGPESTVPAGLKVQAFNYCQTQTQCWDASVLVPADAQLVSSDCKQYVFEMKVQGSPFILLAGASGTNACAGRSANDPSQVRWNQLVDPETKRAPGSSSTISSQMTKMDGKPAVITMMNFKKGLADYRSKRAEVESNGFTIVVGCMAPRDRFADGDTICSALIESLRLP